MNIHITCLFLFKYKQITIKRTCGIKGLSHILNLKGGGQGPKKSL
jgi:hypothetical protein